MEQIEKGGRFKTWLRSTYIHRVFVQRAFRRRSAKVLYVASGIFALCATGWFIQSLNPVLDLEQMDVATGVVEKVGQARRTSCGDKLYLRVGEQQKKYEGCLDEAQAQAIQGREVTVWSQRNISIYGRVDYINQIQIGDQLVKDYRQIKPNREKAQSNNPLVIGTFIFLAVLPLLIIWWINRKDDPTSPSQ